MNLLLLSILLSRFVGHARGEFPGYPMTVTEMEVVAGYYTEGGTYLGGIPKLDDLSKEIYECLDDNYFFTTANDTTATNASTSAFDTGHATACMHWRADESAGGTFQLGSCECKNVQNEAYCEAWVCVQAKEVQNCDADAGACYVKTNTDSVLCQCDVENASGLYCDSWSCKQIDSEGREEYETYHCQRESASGHYCEAWNGKVASRDEIEVVTCECVAEWSGDRVCSYWECEELGLQSCARSRRGWCNVGLSVGFGGGLGFLGIIAFGFGLATYNAKRDWHDQNLFGGMIMFVGIVWCLGWSSCVVIWGGVKGATIVGIIWGMGLLLVTTIVAYCTRQNARG